MAWAERLAHDMMGSARRCAFGVAGTISLTRHRIEHGRCCQAPTHVAYRGMYVLSSPVTGRKTCLGKNQRGGLWVGHVQNGLRACAPTSRRRRRRNTRAVTKSKETQGVTNGVYNMVLGTQSARSGLH